MSPADGLNAKPPTSQTAIKRQLVEFADTHTEWFVSVGGRVPFEINRAEFDFSAAHGRLFFWSWTENGTRAWRVLSSHLSDDKVLLRVSRRLGAQVTTIELVPRASARALMATVTAARQMRCEQLAELVAKGLGDRVLGVDEENELTKDGPKPNRSKAAHIAEGEGNRILGVDEEHESKKDRPKPTRADPLHANPYTQHPSIKIERATLSPGMRRDQPGRYARIILRLRHERVAVTSIVAESDPRNV